MGLLNRGKKAKGEAQKSTEAAQRAKEAAARKAHMAEQKARVAESRAKGAQARAEKAEKELKQMKSVKARQGYMNRQKAAHTAAKSSRVIADYTVKKGDTLSQIAKNFYGSGGPEYWKLIQGANKSLIQDPNLIHPGQVFKIPPLPGELKKK